MARINTTTTLADTPSTTLTKSKTTTLADMSLATLTKPKTATTGGDSQIAVAAATINIVQSNTVMMEKTTKRVYKAIKETGTIPEDTPTSAAEISLAVLAALDCIVVDQYKEDFSLFAAQSQKSLPNPNIGDIEIMTRENSTTVPSNQFPNADGVFYELDEGYSIAQQKEAITAALPTRDFSMLVADIVSQNFSSDATTLKQLSATTLNVSSANSPGTSSSTKKVINNTRAAPITTAGRTGTTPITTAGRIETGSQKITATTNYSRKIKY